MDYLLLFRFIDGYIARKYNQGSNLVVGMIIYLI